MYHDDYKGHYLKHYAALIGLTLDLITFCMGNKGDHISWEHLKEVEYSKLKGWSGYGLIKISEVEKAYSIPSLFS